jgi:polysaccharide export outer membrane protein
MKKIVPVLLLFIFLYSCGTKEDVVYFNGIGPKDNMVGIDSYMPTYHIDDELLIIVNGVDPEAVKPFNLTAVAVSQSRLDGYGRERIQTYIIDPEGNVDFPVIGKVKLAGLNREQAKRLFEKKLKDYLKDPIVNINTINYKITVLGEVARPGTYTATNERITLIEALGMAGDLTIHGERENVLVIRDYDGKKTYTRVNLKSKDLFNSPVYYLTQNDVVYVEPNKAQARASKIGIGTNVAISIVGILISVATLVVTLVN